MTLPDALRYPFIAASHEVRAARAELYLAQERFVALFAQMDKDGKLLTLMKAAHGAAQEYLDAEKRLTLILEKIRVELRVKDLEGYSVDPETGELHGEEAIQDPNAGRDAEPASGPVPGRVESNSGAAGG